MNITIEVTVAQVVWTDQHFNPINKIDEISDGSGINDLMLSLNLTINEVQVSNAGVYICDTLISDTLGDVATIERQYTLTVESKSHFINNHVISNALFLFIHFTISYKYSHYYS